MLTDISQQLHSNPPYLLDPAGKDYLWGGRRLKDDFSKNLPVTPLAETWECSTHPDGLSLVRGFTASGSVASPDTAGKAEGKAAAEQPEPDELTLHELLRRHPEYIGTHPAKSMPDEASRGEIPILIKFIDASKDLSVQVHPDDDYARIHENGQLGKTEMWYVVDAAKGASLVYGFNRDMDAATVRRAASDGSLERYLQKIPVEKDDVFFIQSGTVHAIGAGTLVVEVQESSNLTYRLYDYDRVDKNGQKRPLHIEKAIDVMNRRASTAPRQPMRKLVYHPGYAMETLCRCKYFEVRRMLLNTQRIHEMASFQTDSTSFHALVCTDGCGVLFYTDTSVPFFRGDTIFVPADSVPLKIHGIATLLDINC